MLPGGGILPGRVLRRAQVQGLQLCDGAVDDQAHVDAGHGHGQQAHRGQHTEAAAHIVGHHKALPAPVVGQGLEGAAFGVGGGEDVLVSLDAVLPGQQLPEDAEGGGGLQGGAGLGDHVHVKVLIAQLIQGVPQSVGGEGVAHEEDPGIVLAGNGLEKLDGAAGAQIGASDADDHQSRGAGTDLFRRGHDPVQFGFLDVLGKAAPADEVGTAAAAVCQGLMGQSGQLVIGAGGGEEFLRAGKIYVYHIASLYLKRIRQYYTPISSDCKEKQRKGSSLRD